MADYRHVIPFILKAEGGKSKAKTDSASKNPAPGSEYHTNRGITWTTFSTLASKLGYVATTPLFLQMQDSIWEKIFKHGYWDAIRGDEIRSQALADTLVDYAWGAGPGTAIKNLQKYLKLPITGKVDDVTLRALNTADEKALHDGFSKYKQSWYLSLKGQEANYAGWRARLESLYKFTAQSIGKGGGVIVGIAAISLILLTVYYLTR